MDNNHISEDFIIEAIQELKLTEKDIRLLDETQADEILSLISSRFVADINRTWWWEALKTEYSSLEVVENDNFNYLLNAWPSESPECCFIPEFETKKPRIFRTTISTVALVLMECPHMEYYVMDTDATCLICETHYNMLYIASSN